MDWSRIPSLSALKAFEAAARHGSLSAAARELNVTHAAIAQHVRTLETELSQSLLQRQGRGVATTEAGRQLSEDLRDGFQRIADGIEAIRATTENRPLSITSTPAFASNWLMPRIGDFWALHPDIKVNINPSIELTDLRRDGFDLGLRFGDGNWPGLESELLTHGDFWVVSCPGFVKSDCVDCLADLSDLPWFVENQLLERRYLAMQDGLDIDALNITYLNTNALVIAATISGLGVSVQPKSLVERDVAAGALVKLCDLGGEENGYFAVTVPGRNPKGLTEFRRWLRKQAET